MTDVAELIREHDRGRDPERLALKFRSMRADAFVFLRGRQPYVRRLQPSEDHIALPITGGKRSQLLRNVLQVFGRGLAWDQLRSSGRDGAAPADGLIAFAAQASWRRPLRSLADRAAAQVEADFEQFARAFDASAFAP